MAQTEEEEEEKNARSQQTNMCLNEHNDRRGTANVR